MQKKLYRSKDDVKISGVCSGISEYTGIDVAIIRLLWVFGTFFTGFFLGIVMYIACVFVIPIEPDVIDADYQEKDI